jgi:hypothetical protein
MVRCAQSERSPEVLSARSWLSGFVDVSQRLLHRTRLSDGETLHIVDTKTNQLFEHLVVIDTLRDCAFLHCAADVDDGLDHRQINRVIGDTLDESTVYLQKIYGEILEVSERGVTTPEVIERELAAELAERCEEANRSTKIRNRSRLGDFETNFVWSKTGFVEATGDKLQDLFILQ